MAAAAEVVIAAAPAAWVCCQFHMDLELLQRIHNMDLLIDDWRTHVAEEAQAAKAAKQAAAQHEGADKSAAAATSFRGSMHSLPGQPKSLLAMVSSNSVSCLFQAASCCRSCRPPVWLAEGLAADSCNAKCDVTGRGICCGHDQHSMPAGMASRGHLLLLCWPRRCCSC